MLSGIFAAVVPESWRTRSGPKHPNDASRVGPPADATAGTTNSISAEAGLDGSTTTAGLGGPIRGRTIDRQRRAGVAGSSDPIGKLGPFGRRLLPREARRRELTAVLALVLVACALSASLPGVWAAHPEPSNPSGQLAAILASDAASASASPSDEPASASPSETDTPIPTDSPSPSPTAAPTKAPVKAPVPPPNYSYVALGDSLTAWPSGNPWPVRLDALDSRLHLVNNAGVPGDETADMLARMNSDVYAYKPSVLFVLAGTNDLGHDVSPATTIANLRAIIVGAKAHKATVVLILIPPDSYTGMASRIDSLNAQITSLGNAYKLVVVDIHTPLSTPTGVYQSKFTTDGLHFSTLGAQTVANAIYARVKRAGL